MAKKGDMLYAWTNDADIKKKAELGGAVTALWKHALESKVIDAVLTVRRGTDLYDAQPVLITDPKELASTAGSLHCGTSCSLNLSRNISTVQRSRRLALPSKAATLWHSMNLPSASRSTLTTSS